MKAVKSRKRCDRELNTIVLKDSPIPSSVKDLKFAKKIAYVLMIKISIRY